jgi:hemerythrin-like domain-containing protein
LSAIRSGREADYEMMRNVVRYLHHYGDRFHHPREDLAFERLIQRDPGSTFQVNQVLKEHREIAVAGDALMAILEDGARNATVKPAEAGASGAIYVRLYRAHLATEDREIVPRTANVLTSQDWADIAAVAPEIPDPQLGGVAAQYCEPRERIILVASPR